MKKIYFTYLFLLGCLFSSAQKIAMENIKHNIAYPGVSNYLNIVVENISCKNIMVSTENGTINKDENNDCRYIFNAEKVGWTEVSIYKVTSEEIALIGKKRIRVKPWPKHTARLGKVELSECDKKILFAHGGITVPIQFGDMSGTLNIVSYNIEIKRKGKSIYLLDNKGGLFTEENKIILKKIKEKDLIIFKNTLVKMPGEEEPRKLDDVKIWISKS